MKKSNVVKKALAFCLTLLLLLSLTPTLTLAEEVKPKETQAEQQEEENEAARIVAVVNGETELSLLELNFHAGLIFQQIVQIPAFNQEAPKYFVLEIPTDNGEQSLMAFILDVLQSELSMKYALLELAQEAETELSAEDEAVLENFMSSLKQTALASGLSLEQLLYDFFGPGADVETVRNFVRADLLQTAYLRDRFQGYEISPDDIAAAYQENRADYDLVSFLRIELDTELSTDKMDELRKDLKTVKNEDDFISKVQSFVSYSEEQLKDLGYETVEDLLQEKSLKQNVTYAELSAAQAAWLFDENRKANDLELIEDEGGNVALYFLAREQDQRRHFDSRHILIKQRGNSEVDKEIAETTANAILKAYEKGGASEELFAELADRYSDDAGHQGGGLYLDTAPGLFVKAYENYCLDSQRKSGDVGMVYVAASNYSGYHLIYFKGLQEENWKRKADNNLRTEAQNAELGKISENLAFEEIDNGLSLVLDFAARSAALEETNVASSEPSTTN